MLSKNSYDLFAGLFDLNKPSKHLIELTIDDQTSNALSATTRSSTHLVRQNLQNKSQIFQQESQTLY